VRQSADKGYSSTLNHCYAPPSVTSVNLS